MGQRVLAENAGVMRVRYVLPNKHYVPVDMKYIGVDNTTPYVVPHHFMVWSNKELGLGGSMDLKGLSLFWKCHLPRVVEQKFDGGCDGGRFFFSIEASFSHPLSPFIGYASRARSADVSPFHS